MKEFWKEYKLFQVLISLFLAVLVWAFSINELNPVVDNDYGPVEIDFIGTEHFAENDLIMISGQNSTMRVRVEGNYKTFGEFNAKDIIVTADVSDYDKPGDYQISGSKIKVNVPVAGLNVASYAPKTLSVTIDRVESREYPVEAQISGTPASGYRYRAPELSMENILVTGPSTILDQIDSVLVSVEANALNESMVYTAPVVFMDEEQNVIQSEFLTPEVDAIDVTIRITKEGEIPLRVDVIPSQTLESDEVSVKIEPETIAVHADQSVLENYEALTLGQIDLSEITLSGVYTFPIQLPGRLTPIGDAPAEATVTVEVKDQAFKHFAITEFTLNDVAATPAPVEVETQSVTITVTGARKFIETLAGEDLSISLSYDSGVLGAGEHELQAMITLNAAGNYELSADTVPIKIVLSEPIVEEVTS